MASPPARSLRRQLAPLVLGALALGGCVPLPYLSPPVRASFVAGGAGGELRPGPTGEAMPRRFEPLLGLRASAHPLALAESLVERPADFGVGYLLEGIPRTISPSKDAASPLVHGAFLEGHLWPYRLSRPRGAIRLGVIARADALFASLDGTRAGVGAAVGVSFELARFVTSPYSSPGNGVNEITVLGYAHGEIGFGLDVTVEYRRLADIEYGAVMLNLTLRLPASIGIALVPLPLGR